MRSGLEQRCGVRRPRGDGWTVAATWHSGIFRSTDQGETWTEHSLGLTEFTVIGLSVVSSGAVLAATLHEVFVSTDSAKSWQPLTAGFPRSAIRPALPSGEGSVAVASVDATVYELDQAKMWQRGMTVRSPITSLAWDRTGRLWIGTENHGVVMARKVGDAWTTTDLGGTVTEIHALAVSQGYLVATTTNGIYRAPLPPM